MTVPNFCKGCGKRLEGLEREVCSTKECLNFLRNTSAKIDPRRNVSREFLLKEMEEDIRKYEAAPNKDLALLVKMEALTREVEAYPWDDCTHFAERHQAILRELLGWPQGPAMTGKISSNKTIQLPKKPRFEDLPMPMGMPKTPSAETVGGVVAGGIADLRPISWPFPAIDGDLSGPYASHRTDSETRVGARLVKGPVASRKYATWIVVRETWLFGKPNKPASKLIAIPPHATLLGTGETFVETGAATLGTGGEWLEVADDFGQSMGWIKNENLRRGPTIKICGDDEGELPVTEQEMGELRIVLSQLDTNSPSRPWLVAILRKRGMTL